LRRQPSGDRRRLYLGIDRASLVQSARVKHPIPRARSGARRPSAMPARRKQQNSCPALRARFFSACRHHLPFVVTGENSLAVRLTTPCRDGAQRGSATARRNLRLSAGFSPSILLGAPSARPSLKDGTEPRTKADEHQAIRSHRLRRNDLECWHRTGRSLQHPRHGRRFWSHAGFYRSKHHHDDRLGNQPRAPADGHDEPRGGRQSRVIAGCSAADAGPAYRSAGGARSQAFGADGR
jgi:hypothetical protein